MIPNQKPSRRTPVQVVIIRNRHDPDTNVFVELVRRAIEGDAQNYVGYVSESLGIGIPVLEPIDPPDNAPYRDALFGASANTIVLEINSLKNNRRSPGQSAILDHALAIGPISVCVPAPVAEGDIQIGPTQSGHAEPGLHPLITTLAVMETIRKSLSDAIEKIPTVDAAKLFISHAKSDGALLAVSIVDFCRRAATLFSKTITSDTDVNFFYDAESIENNSNWRESLRDAACQGVLIALRTDDYDTRYWCRQEFQWADENRRPIVVVDLRKTLMSGGGHLPFDCAPTVRVSDGNIIRIVMHAIAAHIRYLKLQWQVKHMPGRVRPIRVLPRHPTPSSLLGLAQVIETEATKGNGAVIVYPGQTLPDSCKEVLEDHLSCRSDIPTKLMSLSQWEAG